MLQDTPCIPVREIEAWAERSRRKIPKGAMLQPFVVQLLDQIKGRHRETLTMKEFIHTGFTALALAIQNNFQDRPRESWELFKEARTFLESLLKRVSAPPDCAHRDMLLICFMRMIEPLEARVAQWVQAKGLC